MKFSLIICTYQRPESLHRLLNSVAEQRRYPNQVLIVDGSKDRKTEILLQKNNFQNLEYFKVEEQDRGLTKQRNFGISKMKKDSEVVCFLDDDVVLTSGYFENLITTYTQFPNAIGVGGYILEEVVDWKKKKSLKIADDEFEYDDWIRKLGSRNVLRKKMRLLSDQPPGIMPDFSHGLSISFLPPSGKTYPVDFFMGGVSSFQKSIFEKIGFSTYFEGYGLYEDMDFCLRVSKLGQLYVNTAATLFHHHDSGGRPNSFRYGKMVLKNGWYVWRVKEQHPSVKAKLKWHFTSLLLTLVRFTNVLNAAERKEAFLESSGRIIGWWSLLFKNPAKK